MTTTLAAALLAAALSALALAPSAPAVATHPQLPFSPITGSGTGAVFHFPSGIAVDETSGNFFVLDGLFIDPTHAGLPGLNGDFVYPFGAEGGVPAGLASPYKMTKKPPFEWDNYRSSAVIDNSPASPAKGTLYIVDTYANVGKELRTGTVEKFQLNPTTKKYELAGELTPSVPYSTPNGIDVDAKGNVYVADERNRVVVKFSPSGTQLERIDLSSILGFDLFSNPPLGDVAVDSAGDLFFRAPRLGAVYKLPANGAGEVNPANFIRVVPPVPEGKEAREGETGGIAVDKARDILYAAGNKRIAQYDATSNEANQQPELEWGFGLETAFFTEFGINSATGRIYVSGLGSSKESNGYPTNTVLAFGYGPKVPNVKTGAATALNPHKETVAGAVNPDGEAVTKCVFEYGTTTAYGSSAPCEGAIPSDSSDHAVSATLSGLTGATTYHYRLAVTNANGTNESVDKTFTTLTPELAVTDPASGVAKTKATLNGTVFPEGKAVTECTFEYGPTTAYGSSVPCAGSIPTDETGHPVSAALAGLQPATTYHFRLSIDGGLGVAHGADRSFTTGAVAITEPATGIKGVKATLNGTVFPEGKAVSECTFEYGLTAAYGATKSCEGSIPADEGSHAAGATIAHLVPNGTTYHFRIVTVGDYGTNAGKDLTLSTADTVLTGAATEIAGHSLTLNGSVNPEGIAQAECLFEYGTTTAYGSTAPCAEAPAAIGAGSSPVEVHADLTGLGSGTVYHYRLIAASADGVAKGADKSQETASTPTIEAQWVTSVTQTEAILKARISPEGHATTYRFEWGPDSSYGSSTAELDVSLDNSVRTVGLNLSGLEPASTYHFRVVATNEVGTTEGEDASFTTFGSSTGFGGDCENEALRGGASADLPDCRAYEMVSPLDKDNSDVVAPRDPTDNTPIGVNQSSLSGDRVAYSSSHAFGDAEGEATASQYLAERGAEGWSNANISPPRGRSLVKVTSGGLHGDYKAFSPDLCSGWLRTLTDLSLAPEAVAGFPNLYRRANGGKGCAGSPGYEAVTTAEPENAPPAALRLEAQGISADSSEVAYTARGQLTGDAPITSGVQLYLSSGGEQHFACVLPDGTAFAGECAAGSGGNEDGHSPNFQNALSADGSRLYWGAGGSGFAKLYLRLNPSEPQSAMAAGKCTEAAKACTLAVSAAAEALSGSQSSSFWGAAGDGSAAVFSTRKDSTHEDLYRYQPAGEKTTLIAGGLIGVMGLSEGASRVYFASEEALTGANAEGHAPTAGKANLYLYEAGEPGSYRFIGTLAAADVNFNASPISQTAYRRFSRVSPDGLHAAFISFASLSGYDNTDLNSGEADAEVFRYDAGEESLICASCNPSGARPEGADFHFSHTISFWLGGTIRGWQSSLYPGRFLADDGSRLFFEAVDALSPRDTNGVMDVYQWEEPGTGGCSEGSPGYSPRNEGCVELISSGQSPRRSEFVDASPSGDDVFFVTLSGFVPQDYGLVDIYDARVDGGFPPPPPPPAACEGEACQGTPEAPDDPTPSSESFEGAGNVKEEAAVPVRKPCAKGKVKRHGKCVAKRAGRKAKRHQRHRAGHGRRAGR